MAIKLIRGHDDRTRGLDRKRERLLREAQALARLDHPNIVSLYDCGTEDGMLFLAMELVDGQSLNQWLRERPRTWIEIVDVISQAADGLSAAHAAGLVHRDFKPSNILVGFDGRVRVLDFGLARAMPEYESTNDGAARARSAPKSFDSLLNTRLTDVNLVLGTNGYMAPEQLMAQSVGPWSDQFALCVTLYEALYGKKPSPGRNAIEVAARFKEGLGRPPSGIRIPLRLRRLLERGLCLDRDGRFRSVRALKRELDSVPRAGWSKLANSVVVVGTAWVAACSAVWLYHALDERSEAPTECRAEIDAPVAGAGSLP